MMLVSHEYCRFEQWDSVEEANHDKDEWEEAVMAPFQSFEPMKLNCSFLTLQKILDEVKNRQLDIVYGISQMRKAAPN